MYHACRANFLRSNFFAVLRKFHFLLTNKLCHHCKYTEYPYIPTPPVSIIRGKIVPAGKRDTSKFVVGGTPLQGTAVCWRTTWGGIPMDGSAAGGAKYRLKVFLEKIAACCGGGRGFSVEHDKLLQRGNVRCIPRIWPLHMYDFDLRWDHRNAWSSVSVLTLVGEGQIVNREMPIVDSWEYSRMRKI